nr:YolD-like family protein [Priestia abyssalis]
MMILKELTQKRLVTINYYQDGILQKCKGRIFKLNLAEQTVLLKDQQQKTFSIRLSRIMEIV